MAATVSESFHDWKASLDKALSHKNPLNNFLDKIEKKTGVSKSYIVTGLGAIGLTVLLILYGSKHLSFVLGFVYPAYSSVKALESGNASEEKRWLTYWVVYAFFSVLEIFIFWLPFFWILKLAFLTYIAAPAAWDGSAIIYSHCIHPLYLKYYTHLDAALDKAATIAGAATNDIVTTKGKAIASDMMKKHVDNIAASSKIAWEEKKD